MLGTRLAPGSAVHVMRSRIDDDRGAEDADRDSGVAGPVAVLDLGANSFHLLVADRGTDGTIHVHTDQKLMVRLGTCLERHEHAVFLGRRALRRGRAAIRVLVGRARSFVPRRLVGVATSVFREAVDAPLLLEAARERHQISIETLAGEDEARLTFLGVQGGLPGAAGATVVIEVGGGSVQIAAGHGGQCHIAASLPLGVTRLRQQVLRADGILRATDIREIAGLVRAESRVVARVVRGIQPSRFVLAAGTARALARLAARTTMTHEDAIVLASRLSHVTPPELVQEGVDPARRDTLALGSVVIATLMETLGASHAVVSPLGLREGVLTRELARDRGRSMR